MGTTAQPRNIRLSAKRQTKPRAAAGGDSSETTSAKEIKYDTKFFITLAFLLMFVGSAIAAAFIR